MFVPMILKKRASVGVIGLHNIETTVSLSGLANGCVGCLLVFESKEAAQEYMEDKDVEVIKIETV